MITNQAIVVLVTLLAVSVHASSPVGRPIAAQSRGDEEGVTELMRAARDGDRKYVKELLEQGADVNARESYGWTALTYAAAKGDAEIVKALIAKGADLNTKDSTSTPLFEAITYNNVSIVRLLIEKGVDINQQNRSGATAMSIAVRSPQKNKIIELLKKAGAVEPAPRKTTKPVEPEAPPPEVPDPAAPPSRAPQPVDSRPVLLNRPEPVYTIKARAEKIQGVVRLRVLIGSDGKVKRVRIVTGLPYGLSEQARAAAYEMNFKPAMKNGQPVAFWLANVEIEFKLR